MRLNLFAKYVPLDDADAVSKGYEKLFQFWHMCVFFLNCRLWQTAVFVVLLVASSVAIVSVYATRSTAIIVQIQNPTYAAYQNVLLVDSSPTCACSQTAFPLSSFVQTNYTLDFFCELLDRIDSLCKLFPSACSELSSGAQLAQNIQQVNATCILAEQAVQLSQQNIRAYEYSSPTLFHISQVTGDAKQIVALGLQALRQSFSFPIKLVQLWMRTDRPISYHGFGPAAVIERDAGQLNATVTNATKLTSQSGLVMGPIWQEIANFHNQYDTPSSG